MNLHGQNDKHFSLRGSGDTLVVTTTATIRKATIKLIERNYFKNLISQQDTIIDNQKTIIAAYKSENLFLVNKNINLNKQLVDCQKINDNLNKNISYYKSAAYICGGTTIVFFIFLLLK